MNRVGDAVIALGGKLDPITQSIGWKKGHVFNKGFVEFMSSDKVDNSFLWICDRNEFEKVAKRMNIDSHAPNWNGQGLPPVGTVCEVNYQEDWVKCEIIAHFKQRAGMVAAFTIEHDDGSKTLDSFRSDCFRPIKSDRDKWIDECAKILSSEYSRVTDIVKNLSLFKGEASAIYDAMKSGKLPKVGD